MDAAQQIPRPAQQLTRIEGLGDVIVRATLESEDAVDLFLLAGDQNDPDIRVCANLPGEGQAIFAWQLDVEQEQRDVVFFKQLCNFVSLPGRSDLEAFFFEVGDQLFAGDGFVFDDENVFLFSHGSSSSWNGDRLVEPALSYPAESVEFKDYP